jgi:hypothetical protein
VFRTKQLISLLILSFILISIFSDAHTKNYQADYKVYFGGFNILNAAAAIKLNSEGYTIKTKSATDGILDLFFEWKGQATSAGRFLNQQPIPLIHSNLGERNGDIRKTILSYNPEGKITSSTVHPAPDFSEVFPLPINAEYETVDPLTVIVALNRRLEKGLDCNANFPVFDGRRRYDLTLEDRGQTILLNNPFSIFSGSARVCKIDLHMIGGHRREKSKYASSARERLIYVARPVKRGPVVPVGLTIETAFGTLMAHLVSIRDSSISKLSKLKN